MVCMPSPAAIGENIPLLTPGPLYVPPVGEPPERAKGAALLQMAKEAGQVTTGVLFTVTSTLVLLLLQKALVTV